MGSVVFRIFEILIQEHLRDRFGNAAILLIAPWAAAFWFLRYAVEETIDPRPRYAIPLWCFTAVFFAAAWYATVTGAAIVISIVGSVICWQRVFDRRKGRSPARSNRLADDATEEG